jgi:hypothetical protein
MSSIRTRLVCLVGVTVALVAALAAPVAAGEPKSDKAILKAGVFTKGDVPAGWTSKKSSSSDPDRSIRECRKIRAAIDKAKKNVPRAKSRDFSDPATEGATLAGNTVYAFKDATAAATFVGNFQADVAVPCLEKSLAKSPVGKKAIGTPTISPLTDLQGVGDEAVGYETTLDLRVAGETATLYIDFIAVRVGRAFVAFGFTNRGERFPDGPAMVQAVVARLAAAQAPA